MGALTAKGALAREFAAEGTAAETPTPEGAAEDGFTADENTHAEGWSGIGSFLHEIAGRVPEPKFICVVAPSTGGRRMPGRLHRKFGHRFVGPAVGR
jgi:hypothetical protein